MQQCGYGELAADAALVVAELATNAVVHARSQFTVTVSSRADALVISVRDGSGVPLVRRNASPIAHSGRGLALVDRLSSSWGIDLFGDQKVVWAEFRR